MGLRVFGPNIPEKKGRSRLSKSRYEVVWFLQGFDRAFMGCHHLHITTVS